MSAWLILEVRWHSNLYHGAEWPPAPMRLLQALVAGNQGTDHPALHWLEQQPAPVILAEPDPQPRKLTLYVPTNNRRDRESLTPKIQTQRRLRAPVAYVWQVPSEEASCAQPMLELATRVHTLGTGLDQAFVVGRIESACPTPDADQRRWVVWPGPFMPPAGQALRTPVAGSLASLDLIHEARLGRRLHDKDALPRVPNPPPARYGVTVYMPETERQGLVYLPILLYADAGLKTLWGWHREDTVYIAAMLRHALMRRVAEWGEPDSVQDFVAGHPKDDPNARLSYVPLPSIGHRHVDGFIRRALLATPLAFWSKVRQCQEWLDHPLPLIPEGRDEPVAHAVLANELDPVFRRYLNASRDWVSVTPVVLPGNYTRGHTLVEKLVRKALRESGFANEDVAAVQASKLPWVAGATHAHHYRRKSMEGQSFTYHVAVSFTQPVPGPIVLGRQRHHGLGLLACANPE
jgi:CRISPR-associated protein Csb2